jgi:hypothetical protein
MRRLMPLFACLSLLAGCTPAPKPDDPAPADKSATPGTDPDKAQPPSAGQAAPEPELAGDPTPSPEEAERAAKLAELPALPSKALAAAVEGFELLLAGDEPRSALRFAPTTGTQEQVELTMRMSMSIAGPGLPPMNQDLPPIKQFNRAETIAVADGRITEKITYEKVTVDAAGVDPTVAAAMQTAMAQLQGFEQTVIYDDRGGIIEGTLDIPEGTDAQLAQTLESLTKTVEQAMVRFPEQPVGIGARWKETSQIANGGLELEQTGEFTLVARDGDQITIETLITQTPLSTKFTPAGIPAELDILEFDSKGSGRVIYDLTKLMPDSVLTTIDTTFKARAAAEGQTQELTFSMQVELEMKRVE